MLSTTYQASAAWSPYLVDTRLGWELTFGMDVAGCDSGEGGHGVTLLLHNDPRKQAAIGANGADLGAFGSSSTRVRNAVGVAISFYRINTFGSIYIHTGDFESNPPQFIQTPNNWYSPATSWATLNSGFTGAAWRTFGFKLTYDRSTNLLTAFASVGGGPMAYMSSATVDIQAITGTTQAYIGFTAGTNYDKCDCSVNRPALTYTTTSCSGN